ncbi:unnamed protein product [Medioppia subpectinata]|uniref:MARVEL domain-containing protein n=1 Tax=Medioppia subpectinata TaxID=1979941 RepID=A0A7R9PYH3_9ACAR|nr:unnamed protein product [Medioppia subpectinata]CAG2105411.1 unnamed protein product [Medioppia subpectinata]
MNEMMSSSSPVITVTRHYNTRNKLNIFDEYDINSGFITSRLGLLKFLILLFSLICLILVLAETQTAACAKSDRRLSDQVTCYKIYTGDLFLLLVNFCHLYVIVLMAVTSIFSITSESLLPKTTFDYVFHHMAFGLYLIGGIWVLIDSLSDGRTGVIITGSLFALLCSAGHLFHGMYSYAKSLDV